MTFTSRDPIILYRMRVDLLELDSFRNYGIQSVEFDQRCNVILGENAQGKTNLLEALVYLSRGRSPRVRADRELIGFDSPSARMAARISSRDREFWIRVELSRERRRQISINQVPAKNSSALSEVCQTVFFCPEDLLLIREGASVRRRFMDTALCQLRPRYAAALTEYNRAYEHKTRILRDAGEHPDLIKILPEFNERLIRFGAVLIYYRSRFVRRLEEHASLHHRECSGGRETLSIKYKTVSTVEDSTADAPVLEGWLRRHMESHRGAELASRLCLSGPHKDDLDVSINGRDARQYASQGQVRTAALALKLAEREIYKNAFGEYPLLLLDDVLSELDPRRQEFVLNRIAGGQVFITCCEDDRLPQLLGGKVFHVDGGKITVL